MAKEAVFKALLEEMPRYEVSRSASVVRLGNPDAKNLLTVVTNPLCNACIATHRALQKLLQDTNNSYDVQYFLTAYDDTDGEWYSDITIKPDADEIARHREWIYRNRIAATPTVLFNGYELPDDYQLDDLRYFFDMDV